MFFSIQFPLACLVVLPLLFSSVFASAQENLLPIVYEDYPPYEYRENGKDKGMNLDLISEAFRRMGKTPLFEPRPWKRALFELKNGDILALSSGFRTPRREKIIFFPDEPLAMETNVVVVPADSELTVTCLADLQGLRVGIVRDYIYGHGIDEMKGFHRIEANSSHQLVRMLANRRMDAAVGNKAVLRHIAKKNGMLEHIRFTYEIGCDPLYLMFSRSRGEEAKILARDFGVAIREMHQDGTFKAIIDRY